VRGFVVSRQLKLKILARRKIALIFVEIAYCLFYVILLKLTPILDVYESLVFEHQNKRRQ